MECIMKYVVYAEASVWIVNRKLAWGRKGTHTHTWNWEIKISVAKRAHETIGVKQFGTHIDEKVWDEEKKKAKAKN